MSTKQLYVYAIKDVVADQYTPLFMFPTDGAARRQFNQFVTGDGMERADYRLFCLGWFEDGRLFANPEVYPTEITFQVSHANMEDS